MKRFLTLLSAILLSAVVWAQQSAGVADHPDMTAMHQQHMQEMKAQLDKMHTKLDEMKANLAKVKDPAARRQIQMDTDLWAMTVGHMEDMQKMMAGPMDHKSGMHQEQNASCCGGMAGCCAAMKEQAGGMKCMQGMQRGTDKTIVPPDKQ